MASFRWIFVGCVAIVTALTAAISSHGMATPPAAPLPTSPDLVVPAEAAPGQWQIEFVAGPMRLYIDPESAESYWYFTYKAVNRTGQDRWWAPKLELLDDHGRLQRSGKEVPVIIGKRIQALIGNPLVEDQYQVLGEIHQGESNAKEGFVVWKAAPLDATELHLFVRGISSEFKRMENPKGGPEVVLHKTLKRDYRVPGDPRATPATPLVCEQTEWILR